MDCYFNKHIPKSEPQKVILRPVDKTFVTGVSSYYEETYPLELENYMSKEEFFSSIKEINDSLFYYWPCFLCLSFGYCFSICTLGLSLCCPYVCVRDATQRVYHVITKINKKYQNRGVKWQLVKHCSTSWIQIDIIN